MPGGARRHPIFPSRPSANASELQRPFPERETARTGCVRAVLMGALWRKLVIGSRAAVVVAHNANPPYYDLDHYPIIWLNAVMTSGRYEIDSHGRRHFRPSIPRLPRLE